MFIYFLYVLIYLFIGFIIIFSIAKFNNRVDDSAWVIGYALGLAFWPIIVVKWIFDIANWILQKIEKITE